MKEPLVQKARPLLLNNPHPTQIPDLLPKTVSPQTENERREYCPGQPKCDFFLKSDKLPQFQGCHRDQRWGLVTRNRTGIVPTTLSSL